MNPQHIIRLKSLFSVLRSAAGRQPGKRGRTGITQTNIARQLAVESLEDRTLLSATSMLEAKLQHTLTGPAVTAEAGALFGYSIAATSSLTVVGAPDATVEGALSAGATYVYANSTGNLLWTLHDPTLDPSTTDGFGFAVAVSEQWIIVSNNHSDPLINKPGEVHIFSATTGAFLRTIANPEPNAGDRFGETFAISGNTLAVGAIAADAGGLNSGTVFTFNVVSGQLLQTIENPTHAAGDNFGRAIAMSGNNLVVGALFEDTGATNAGSAYVFNAATGELIREFNNPTPQASDEFGASVAIDGDVVAIQAHKDNTGASQAGSVYLYRISTGSLLPFRTINNPSPTAGDEFGYHVSLSGNKLAVGVPFEDVGASNAGVLYVYDITTNAAPLVISNPAAAVNDFFAFRSTFVGTDIVVSGAYDDASGVDAGTVYRFAAGATTPNRTYSPPLTIPDAGSNFGQEVVVSSNYFAVAALDHTVDGLLAAGLVSVYEKSSGRKLYDLKEPVARTNRFYGVSMAAEDDILVVAAGETPAAHGTVYVYQMSTGNLLRTFVSPDGVADQFGSSVSISGQRLVVGAIQSGGVGKVWIFDVATGSLLQSILNPEPVSGDAFGTKVSIFGTQLLVSAPFDDFGASNSGSLYVFNAATGGTPTATIRNPSPSVSENFPSDLAIHSGKIIASSMLDDTTATDAGIAYIFNATNGALQHTLTNPVGGASDWFGYGAAISEQFVAISVHSADRGATNAGAVAIFNVANGQFELLIDNPTPSASSFFGNTGVGLFGSSLVVGATGADSPSTDSGAAYLYQLQHSRLSLVKDINPGNAGSNAASSNPASLTEIDGILYFSATTADSGLELWRSDGTESGTYMVRNINPGSAGSDLHNFIAVNGVLYFSAGGSTDWELWRSDGTSAGTYRVKDIFAGPSGSGPREMVNVNGTLMFAAFDGTAGIELWKSDGTESGTTRVADIIAGSVSSFPQLLTNVNGVLYFTASDNTGDRELWKSDGTAGGTARVKNIAASQSANPQYLVNANGTLYFIANNGVNGLELWKSNGTDAGTTMVKDIAPNSISGVTSRLTNLNGVVYFSATDNSSGYELWKSDGTSAGTIRVKDIVSGATSSSPTNLVNVNGILYFVARETSSGRELWRSDGTTAGTTLVKDIFSGASYSQIDRLTNVQGTLYFTAQDSVSSGMEMWRSDGTSAGTLLVTDVTPAANVSSSPQFFSGANGRVFASADSKSFGRELWVIDTVSLPNVTSGAVSTPSGFSMATTLSASDRSDATLGYTITQPPAHGTLSGTAPNLTYTPNSGFVGTDEFFFTASNAFGASSEGRIEISVYGTPSTVSFAASSSTVGEAISATSINVTLSQAVSYDTTVLVSVGGTATAASDYRTVTEVVIPAGQTSAPLNLGIIDDTRFEGSTAETVVLTLLSNPAVVLGSLPAHTVQITDNDTMPKVSFERPGLQLAEGSGTTQIRVVLDAESNLDVVVPLQVVSSATNGTDFTLGATSVTIPAGSRSATFPLTIADDTVAEMGEFIVIAPGAITNATLSSGNTATQFIKVTIPPNDSPILNLVTSGVYVSEGVGTVTVTATLSEAPLSTLSVPFSFAGQMTLGTDFTVSATAFSFAAGSKSASVTVTIINDTLVEQVESTVLVIAQPQTTSYLIGPIGASAITVTDNDTPKISFSTSSSSVWEDAGNVTITATLSVAQPTQVTVPVSVSSALAGDYATNGTDFELLQPSFVFAPNSTTASVTLRILNNPGNEQTERVVLRLDAPFETAATSPNGIFLGSVPTTEIQILDDDPFVSVSGARYNETNGDGFFTFTLSSASNKTVTVPFKLGGDATAGSDYTKPTSTSVTIAAGKTSATFAVRLKDDTADEREEQISLTMGTPSNSIASGATAGLAIVDNDADPTVNLSMTRTGFERDFRISPRISESTEAARTVTVNLSQPTYRDVFVDLEFSGTATYGTDYETTGLSSSRRITIPAGKTSATFKISAINDGRYEGPENIKIKVRNVSNAANEKTPKELTVNVLDSSEKPKPVAKKNVIEDAGVLAGTSLLLPPGVGGSTISLQMGTPINLGETDLSGFVFTGSESDPAISSSNRNDALVPMTLRTPFVTLAGPLSETSLFFDANFNGVQDFLDLNSNGVQDEDEPSESSVQSQADGSSAFEFDPAFDLDGSGFLEPSEGRMVAANGVDTATGLQWDARMTAPMGIYSLTPLTTLVESLPRTQFLTVPDAIDRVVTAFGIEGYDLRFGNPLYSMLDGDALAAKAWSAHTQLYTAVLEISQLYIGFSGNTLNTALVAETVFDQIAAGITVEGSNLQLSSTNTIRAIIKGVGVRLGYTIPDSILDGGIVNLETVPGPSGVAAIIAHHMAVMQSYDFTAFSNKRDFAEQFIKAKVVMQSDAATRLNAVGTAARQSEMAGSAAVNSAHNDFTGAALQSRIVAADAGVVVPAAVGITDSQIVEGDNGQQMMEFTVVIVGEHEGNVSASYSTFDGTATAESGDYIATTGTLTWAAGDMTSRTIQVPILGDTIAELDESFTLALTSATSASIRRQEGTAYIANNDALTINTSVAAPTGDSVVEAVMDGADGGLYQNGQVILQGLIVSPLTSTIQGASNRSDSLMLNFGKERFRSDSYTFTGGTGTGSDRVVANGGTFSEIRHTILSGASGHSLLRPQDALDVPINALWSEVETIDYSVAAVDLFIIRIPASVSSIIVEDADLSAEGQMRIRSASGQFAPIVFTSPTSGIYILRDSASTTVDVQSTDPSFTGTVTSAVSAVLNNSTTTLSENTSTAARIRITDVQIDSRLANQTISIAGADAALFEVDGASVFLRASSSLDHETKSTLVFDVRVSDANGAVAVLPHSLSITNANEAPTDIALSASQIPENLPPGTEVGQLSTSDVDASPTFEYSLVVGSGDSDNSSFEIVGNRLRSKTSFDFETKNTYSVRIRSTDQGGLIVEKQFVVSITDAAEDLTAPTSLISPLPAASNSLTLNITVTGSDPGANASGVKEYDLYYSTGGVFILFATVSSGAPSTTFTGNPNTNYWFRSLGRDHAGNVETKTTSDTYTRIGDVVPPSSQVTSATSTAAGLITLNMSGTKISGSVLTAFDVYVTIDGGGPMLVGTANAVPTGGGNYTGQIVYQGLADGGPHTYSFYSRARDGAGNVEAAPATGDVTQTWTFASTALTATGIDVQNGVSQRSYVRYLDVLFSTDAGLNNLLTAGRVKVERFGIDATSVVPGTGTVVAGAGLSQSGNKLRLDFGATGLGGLRQAGNGFYRVLLDMDGNGSFADSGDSAFEFHRLFGDATGDGKVDAADTARVNSQFGRTGANLDGDIDGNGAVTSTDRLFVTQQLGKKLLDPLLEWLDD